MCIRDSFVGLAIMTIGLLAAEPLAYALGSTPTIAPYAMEYLGYLMPGAPFLIASLVLNNQLRFQGSAFYAMTVSYTHLLETSC